MPFSEGLQPILVNGAAMLGISLKPEETELLHRYFLLLKKPPVNFRISAIKEDEKIVVLHILDALTVLNKIPESFPGRIIDVGAGNGVPGFVIKLLRPQIKLTSLESRKKPIFYLERVRKEFNIDGWDIIEGRAEDIGHEPACRERFDTATARALASLRVAVELILPLVRTGGCFLAMKGMQVKEEIEDARYAIDILGGEIEAVEQIVLPYQGVKRAIVTIRKIKNTPLKYPRRYSAIKRGDCKQSAIPVSL